jgi:hypothetical protein
MTSERVLTEILEVLTRSLPTIPLDDAGRPHLAGLAPQLADALGRPRIALVEGGARSVDGEEVLARVGDLLADLLPDVPLDDASHPALMALAYAAGRPDAHRRLVPIGDGPR